MSIITSKKFYIPSLIFILIIILIFFNISYNLKGFLTIKNVTGEKLTNVELIYSNTNEKINIGELENNKSYRFKVNTNQEQALSIKFLINGNLYEENVIGYICAGFESKTVKIKKYKDNIKLE